MTDRNLKRSSGIERSLSEKEALFLLSHIPGVGTMTLFKMKEYFQTFCEAWYAKEHQISSAKLMLPKVCQAFQECKKDEARLRKEYEELEKNGIRFLAYFEEEYPERLQPYKDKPAGLFVRGNLPDDRIPSVSIVGARNCTLYGKQIAEHLAKELSEQGVQIVSGLALGVDSAAHRGCLTGGGRTYAVLGCGVNICYPRENYVLFSQVEEHGGIISEFVPGTQPVAMNFPMRNRIISGLADAVIIVEARNKSGSLITGDLALEQGKEVFAVPGRLDDPLSAGCNKLLQSGAALCLGAGDVLDFLGLKYEKKLKENKIPEKSLAKNEKLVYSAVCLHPRSLDEIITFCQISVAEALESLMTLELGGWIRSEGNQYYCRKM